MKLSDIRRKSNAPIFIADCDECDFKLEAIGMNALDNMMEKSRDHRNKTSHTTEVSILQSLIVFRDNYQSLSTLGGA